MLLALKKSIRFAATGWYKQQFVLFATVPCHAWVLLCFFWPPLFPAITGRVMRILHVAVFFRVEAMTPISVNNMCIVHLEGFRVLSLLGPD